jgi:hypothetical protein
VPPIETRLNPQQQPPILIQSKIKERLNLVTKEEE